MTGRTLAIARKELIQLRRDTRSLILAFLLPPGLILFFGYAIQFDVENIRLVVWDGDRTQATGRLVDAFRESGKFRIVSHPPGYAGALGEVEAGGALAALAIAPGFTADLAAGRPAPLQLVLDGSDANTATIALDYSRGVVSSFSTRATLEGRTIAPPVRPASRVWYNEDLESRNMVNTERGRIAIGWLIVEDIAMVLALVMLPAIFGPAQGASAWTALGITIVKVAGFMALMIIVGRRLIPWLLHWVVHTGSRELFRLAVLSIALGVAFGAAYLFDVSFALGAFFAGMILGETQLSRRAAEETLPLRDAFAVLFFVSVGMLFDPAILLEQPMAILATLAIIIFGKSLAAYGIVRAFGRDNRTAIAVSASLAQIGEFSFILAGLGTSLGVLPDDGRDLILAGAIISILLHPFVFSLAAKRARRLEPQSSETPKAERIVVVGYGRVGKLVAASLKSSGRDFVLIDDQADVIQLADEAGMETVRGNAAARDILVEAGIGHSSHLLLAIPEGFEAGGIADTARKLKPDLNIIARAHSQEEVKHLLGHGATTVIMGEEEIARQMLRLVPA